MKLISALLIFGVFSIGCGPKSSMVTVTLVPSTGTDARPFHSLKEDFFGMRGPLLTSARCEQTHLITVVANTNINDDKDQTFQTYPLTLNTEIVNGSYDATWLSAHSYFDKAIQVSVPRGQLIDVGITGAFFFPADVSPTDGICDDHDPSGNPLGSIGWLGHTDNGFVANADMTVPLNVFVFQSTPNSPYPSPTYDGNGNILSNSSTTSSCVANYFCCVDPQNFNTCPVKDLVDIYTNNPTYLHIAKVEYGVNINNGPHVVQVIPNTASHVYSASLFPMYVTANDGTNDYSLIFFDANSAPQIAGAYTVSLKRVGL